MIAAVLIGCAARLGHPVVEFGAGPAVLPLVTTSADRERAYVGVDVPGQGTWVFFFDTGYAWSACDDGLARALALDPRGRVRTRGTLGAVRAPVAVLPDLWIGGHRVSGLHCTVRDLATTSSIRDPEEVRVAGVLGSDVLARFGLVWRPEGAVELHAPTEPLSLDGLSTFDVRREHRPGRRPRIPLDVGDERVWAVIDTGSNGTLVRNLDVPGSEERVALRGSGAGDADVRVVMRWDVDVQLGGRPLGLASLRSTSGPALVGLDLLGDRPVVLDLARGIGGVGDVAPDAGRPLWSEMDEPVLRFDAPSRNGVR